MTRAKKSLGDWGEKVAIEHLTAAGFTIREKNWRCSFGELDLIAQKNGELHFVEVKTRRGRSKGSPEESITPRKAERLMRTGLMYIGTRGLGELNWQIDLLAIELDASGKLTRCELLENFVVF